MHGHLVGMRRWPENVGDSTSHGRAMDAKRRSIPLIDCCQALMTCCMLQRIAIVSNLQRHTPQGSVRQVIACAFHLKMFEGTQHPHCAQQVTDITRIVNVSLTMTAHGRVCSKG